jgi:hypothetical protein
LSNLVEQDEEPSHCVRLLHKLSPHFCSPVAGLAELRVIYTFQNSAHTVTILTVSRSQSCQEKSPKKLLYVLPPKDNASQVSINVENYDLENTAAGLSISEDAASELESLPSQSSQTSHSCAFDIKFDPLKYRGKLLEDVQYRPWDKRVLNKDFLDLSARSRFRSKGPRDYTKLWLCRRCHEKEDDGSQLFDAKSTVVSRDSFKKHSKVI